MHVLVYSTERGTGRGAKHVLPELQLAAALRGLPSATKPPKFGD